MLALFIVLSVVAGLASSQSSSTVMTSPSTSTASVDAWQDLGVMALRAIAELTRVCIVVSRRDYSLGTSQSFTYIKYPSSYRTTLTQATDVVDGAFRTTEMSASRVQMIMSQVSSQLRTALTILSDGTIQDRQMMLPSTLKSITRMGEDAASAIGKASSELERVVGFFDELLRAVQPSPPPSTTASPSGSTSTQSNKGPLDIDHATALSNILASFKSLIALWNQVIQQSNKLALRATEAIQFINDRNTLLWTLGDIDEAMDLLRTLTSTYTDISIKAITSRTTKMASYLMLESEQERLAKVQKVNEGADHNIPEVQKLFAEVMLDHATHNKERIEQYNRLAATPST